MRHLLLGLVATGLLAGTMSGCAAIDRNRADEHHQAAKDEAKGLHFGKAAKEQKRANQANRDADRDRL